MKTKRYHQTAPKSVPVSDLRAGDVIMWGGRMATLVAVTDMRDGTWRVVAASGAELAAGPRSQFIRVDTPVPASA